MKELFNDIVDLDGVKSVLLISLKGEILFKSNKEKLPGSVAKRGWEELLGAVEGLREVDLVYETGRLYLRKTPVGYLVVLAGLGVPIAMLRLNCDIVLPALRQNKGTSGGIKRFFKK